MFDITVKLNYIKFFRQYQSKYKERNATDIKKEMPRNVAVILMFYFNTSDVLFSKYKIY